MSIQKSDIVLVLSGGATNTDPDQSLGGFPSTTPIVNALNNLFSDVTNEQAVSGLVDYRCFYVFNDNATDIFKSVKIWVNSQVEDGSDAQLGVAIRDDLQLLTVGGNVNGGFLTMQLDGHSFSFVWDSDLAQWATNLKTAINNLPGITGVHVAAGQFGSVSSFQILFKDDNSNRYFPLMNITSMSLTGTGSITATMTKLIDGSPINAVAPDIDLATSLPTGVTFQDSNVDSPIEIGNVGPTEGFSVWVKRTTVGNSTPLAADGFTFGLEGDPIQ